MKHFGSQRKHFLRLKLVLIPIGILSLAFCKSTKRGYGPRKHNMKHHKHYHYPEVKNAKLNARGEAVLDLLTVLAIGVGMAVLLVAWWSA